MMLCSHSAHKRRFSFASSSIPCSLCSCSFFSISLSLCCFASSFSRCCCCSSRKPLPSQIIMSMAGVGQARPVCPQAAVCRRCLPPLHRPPFPSCLSFGQTKRPQSVLGIATRRAALLIQRKSQMTKIKYCCNRLWQQQQQRSLLPYNVCNKYCSRSSGLAWSLCHVYVPYGHSLPSLLLLLLLHLPCPFCLPCVFIISNWVAVQSSRCPSP